MLADPYLSVYRRAEGVDSGAFLIRLPFASLFAGTIVPYTVSKAQRQCSGADADGDISNYYPDLFVKLSERRIVKVETKGQKDLDVPLKMERLRQWCQDINRLQSVCGLRLCFRGPGRL